MKNRKSFLTLGALCLAAFILWTALVLVIDVRPIGPEGSQVGFAALNGFVHELTGVNWTLYTITDWLGLVPFAIVGCFGLLGLWQLIRRKKLWQVDRDILVLGIFYVVVLAVYALFEVVPINYRPVLVEGILEVSYPSSTTMLSLCVIPTTMLQVAWRFKTSWLRYGGLGILGVFGAFMVVGRLISGVHWFSDIFGGALLSAGLVLLYYAFAKKEA